MKSKKQKTKIAVGSLRIGSYAKRLIRETLNKNRLSYGPLTIKFENDFAEAHGARYGLFTVSGTSALKVALLALKNIHRWKDGDEVIVPAVTFIATSNIVLQNNMTPVFVDVDPQTYNIDPKLIEEKITKRTRAIIPVHLFGLPAEMEAIMKIARKHNLKVIADSCETMAVKHKGKQLGQLGDIVCFSTYAAHLLITGVGGIAITNDPRYATKMRSLMNHGRDTIYYYIDQDDRKKKGKAFFSLVDRRFSFIDVGHSHRLTEMEAAIGLEGLKELSQNVVQRRKNYNFLAKKLSVWGKYLQLPFVPEGTESAHMMLPIMIKEGAGLKRKELIEFLEDHGIETRYAMPLLSQPVYKKIFGNIEKDYPVAQWINHNGFYIGCHQYLSKSDLEYVADIFEKFFAGRKKKK